MNSNPKVFICHGSEDKDRFVMGFAKKLRGKGVDAWLDHWEIKPGDSLIDKIFEVGIKECEVFIIILSKMSAEKKWVKEELNSATIQRIEKNKKIIPVIIDENVEVPMSLKHLLREKISDVNNYDKEFDRILNSIFDISEKPPLGEKPKYSILENNVEGLSKTDSIVLQVIGDIVYSQDCRMTEVFNKDIFEKCDQYDLSHESIVDSLGVLASDNYIHETSREYYRMTPYGFLKYCENFVSDLEEKCKSIVSSIVNENLKDNKEISERSGCKLVLVNSFLQRFEDMQYIRISKELTGGKINIYEILPKGTRYLKSALQ